MSLRGTKESFEDVRVCRSWAVGICQSEYRAPCWTCYRRVSSADGVVVTWIVATITYFDPPRVRFPLGAIIFVSCRFLQLGAPGLANGIVILFKVTRMYTNHSAS